MPEPASSFMVGNAPGGVSFASPLLNFSPIGNLPQDYYQGQVNQRQLARMNAFRNGVPTVTNPDGTQSLDVNQVLQTGAKLGGLDYLQGLLPYMLNSGAAASDAKMINAPIMGGGGTQPANASSSVPGASGPANIRGNSAPQQQPQLSTVGADNNGSDTLRSVAVESFGGKDVTPLLPRFASALGVDSDQPLSPQQVSQARTLMGRTAQNLSGNTASDVRGGGGAPVAPVDGTSGSPAPAGGNPPETAQPSAGIVPNGTAPDPMATARQLAHGYDPVAFVNAAQQRANALLAQADQAAALPGKAGDARAATLRAAAQLIIDTQVKPIQNAIQQSGQATLESGLKTSTAAYNAASEANVKSAVTKLAGITGAANQYEGDLQPKLQIAQSVLNDPGIWTGTGGDFSLGFNKLSTAVGGSPKAALLQEVLSKVTASSILSQINGLKDMMMQAGGASSSAGRIFQQQVELMQKASPQLGTTLAGNRALVELERRAGEQSVAIRNLALDYLGPPDANGVGTNHKTLDTGFDKIAANYLKTHPMFSTEEMAHPELFGAPTAPAGITNTAGRVAWGNGMGLRPGDAFRAPNGQYKYWQQPQAAQPQQ